MSDLAEAERRCENRDRLRIRIIYREPNQNTVVPAEPVAQPVQSERIEVVRKIMRSAAGVEVQCRRPVRV
jgi:hypothetical protein